MRNIPSPVLIAHEKENVPHLVIEVNQECNIRCKACYKNLTKGIKSVDEIKTEIDFALSRRHAKLITLAGGEPTLHPELDKVISYIASKGIKTYILSNGFVLSREKLKGYKKAGLVGVLLHVDAFQARPDCPNIEDERQCNILRETIAQKISEEGIVCFLEITLYKRNLENLMEFVLFVAKSWHFDYTLITCFTDFRKIAYFYNNGISHFNESDFDEEVVKNEDVEKKLFSEMGIRPFAYCGSNKSIKEKRWLYYYMFCIRKRNGKVEVLPLLPQIKRFFNLVNSVVPKDQRQSSLRGPKMMEKPVLFAFLYGIFSFDIKIFFNVLSFLKFLLIPGATLCIKTFVFQQGPNIDSEGNLEYCYHCPDATVRDGVLTPVCLVDLIDENKRIQL